MLENPLKTDMWSFHDAQDPQYSLGYFDLFHYNFLKYVSFSAKYIFLFFWIKVESWNCKFFNKKAKRWLSMNEPLHYKSVKKDFKASNTIHLAKKLKKIMRSLIKIPSRTIVGFMISLHMWPVKSFFSLWPVHSVIWQITKGFLTWPLRDLTRVFGVKLCNLPEASPWTLRTLRPPRPAPTPIALFTSIDELPRPSSPPIPVPLELPIPPLKI